MFDNIVYGNSVLSWIVAFLLMLLCFMFLKLIRELLASKVDALVILLFGQLLFYLFLII